MQTHLHAVFPSGDKGCPSFPGTKEEDTCTRDIRALLFQAERGRQRACLCLLLLRCLSAQYNLYAKVVDFGRLCADLQLKCMWKQTSPVLPKELSAVMETIPSLHHPIREPWPGVVVDL